MSTEMPEGNEEARGTSGRMPRLGDARSPVGSTLSIVLAVVAVVAGFLILRELTDDDGGGGGIDDITANSIATGDTTGTAGSGVSPTNAIGGTTTTSSPASTRVTAGATIAVVNASGVGGSAAQMSTALETAGYTGLVTPGNTTGAQQEASTIHFLTGDAAAQAVAESIAADFGGVAVSAIPDQRPATGGDTATATVLVMLGTDAAGKSIAELSAATADTTAG
ncbi:MAG: LytR C-terminal domain-containing protein [Desertimonas sp.]